MLRRMLGYRITVAGLTEIALWLAGAYLTIGLVWSFFHPDAVQHIQEHLEQLHLPLGTNYQLAALGEASVLWPVVPLLPTGGCAHSAAP